MSASADAIPGKTAAGTANPAATSTVGISLGDRMKELLVDFDGKSAQKEAAKLSASELQAALALVGATPNRDYRESLRWYLYQAWTALNPSAAWKAAVNDQLQNDNGDMLGAVAAKLAKTNPAAAIDLALSLGIGDRRSGVLNRVFFEWSKVDVAAAISYLNAHPDLSISTLSFSRDLSVLSESEPMHAANLSITLKDEHDRHSALSNVMTTWLGHDRTAALNWAQFLANTRLRQDAIATAIGTWAKTDPLAALAYARASPDAEIRTGALQNAWKNWFRKDPSAATAYLASSGDEMLMENVVFNFPSLSGRFTPTECAAFLAQLPDSNAKQKMMGDVTDSQIRKGQFNQALEMLNAMPDSSDRDRSVHKLGQEWAKADLDAAAHWLKLQPDSSDRDLAVAGYASALARTDPSGALEWVKSIPDQKVRQGAMKNIAVRWLKADPAKAEAWIAGEPQFSDNDKRSIRTMASISGDYIPTSVTVGTRR